MAVAAKKPPKFPKSFGACADLLWDLREKRLAQKKIVDELEAEEKALKEHIINGLPVDDGGAVGKHHKVVVVKKEIPQVKDWDSFYAYVAKTKSFDLLERRLSAAAVTERLEAKKVVPGVEIFKTKTISLTKV